MNKVRRPRQQQKPKPGDLPILIRYKTQDYSTRYLPDPRIMYIEEYHDIHKDDGFLAMIPPQEKPMRGKTWLAAFGVAMMCLSFCLCASRLL